MDNAKFAPARWASAPGETIAELTLKRSLSREQLAIALGLKQTQLISVLGGNQPITESLAERLATFFETSSKFWLQREQRYRNDLAMMRESEQSWLKSMPTADMAKMGWIKADRSFESRINAHLDFFGCATLDEWLEDWQDVLENTAFRTSPSFDQSIAAVAAWLRRGEIESATIRSEVWSPDRFTSSLPAIRSLTRERDPKRFLPALQEICAESGVIVRLVKAPEGCRASGATKFINSKRALVLLSGRYLTDDHFWFTFFHEAGHLLLHDEKLILEFGGQIQSAEELEANAFAQNILLNGVAIRTIANLGTDSKKIIRWARDNDIAPGIVVGQLQHAGVISHGRLNWLKRRFRWT